MCLFISYSAYSIIVYTNGTSGAVAASAAKNKSVDRGKLLFQQYNCSACHQLYGLGGFLGPDLTTAWSDPQRGEAYIKAFLRNGSYRMPNFSLTEMEIDAIARYLEYIDTTAITYKQAR